MVRDYRSQANKIKWQPGVAKHRNAPVNYEIETEQGYIWRCHADQIRPTAERVTLTPEDTNLDNYFQEENNVDNTNGNVVTVVTVNL